MFPTSDSVSNSTTAVSLVSFSKFSSSSVVVSYSFESESELPSSLLLEMYLAIVTEIKETDPDYY